ncbi:MAG: HD domain-containing protein [Solirubrobacterales bacterium]|nr:HD domain-containing protein [Solirubrobacterales bacterium]
MSGAAVAALEGLSAPAWLVGGAVRDRLLGRTPVPGAVADLDVVVDGDVASAARTVAQRAGGFGFELSEAFGAWRVVARDRSWQLDLLGLGGETIEDDLARRDFTVNAIALRLPEDAGAWVDPFGGRSDLERRRLRMVAPGAFAADPLRTLRLARLACELGFAAQDETARAARASADALRGVAPERVFAELRRIVCADRALDGLALMTAIGATEVVLPELIALEGVQQSRYHHLDVSGHTEAVLSATIRLAADPSPICRSDAEAETVRARLDEPLADEMTRGQALRFGALLHDIAKPQTRGVTSSGRVSFLGHDEAGAVQSAAILERLRASQRLREYVAALTRHHLRLGFLVHRMPLPRRAIYDYLDACSPVGVDVTLLSVADRLATRGDNAARAIALHVSLARELLPDALAWETAPPRPPVRGDELARALGIEPGPILGELLAELRAESFSGEVTGPRAAVDRARQLLAQRK